VKKIGFIFFFLFTCFACFAQTRFSNFRSKTISLSKDSVQISAFSISPVAFEVYQNKKRVNPKYYKVDFSKATLYIDSKIFPVLTINYTEYPDFLTKSYSALDRKLIVPDITNTDHLFSISNDKKYEYTPFKGLYTKGGLVRGITIGNNQDAVLNSSLDLQMSGKLSNDVTIRASISDSNIPIQENGYSQKIEEFDRVFIELFSEDWNLKAGDILLSNTETNFLKFDKKVAGLSVDSKFTGTDSKTHIKASGALVRGQFTRQEFKGIEGNQGPYKLEGPHGASYIVILSGTETVFVNGIALKRGAQNDYTIDYNTAELTFTTTYPITADMRITVEFQYSDKNYTRFITYDKINYTSDKLEIGAYFYNENDAKNQPLQQNLTDLQKEKLAAAGNDPAQMVYSSAYPEGYDENKIQYKKMMVNGSEVFEFTQEKRDDLYTVLFQSMGEGGGSYRLKNTIATGKIYEYIGDGLGAYEPIRKLVAPTKTQVAVANVIYKPSSGTAVNTEFAFSENDQNLFSAIDDHKNKGIASKIGWTQIYTDQKWLLKSNLNFDYLQQNFKSVQPMYNVEFNRDWNLQNTTGDQEFLSAELLLSDKAQTQFSYNYESLKHGASFKGSRHLFESNIRVGKTSFISTTSFLKTNNTLEATTFLKASARLKQQFKNMWMATSIAAEDNQVKNTITHKLNLHSQKYLDYGADLGIGDSAKVHVKVGFNFRVNDSVRDDKLTEVNSSKQFYLKSKLVQNKNTDLFLYANYRAVENKYFQNHTALNSRLSYSQKMFKEFLNLTTVYETSSGTSPQREFTYIKTEVGQGYYTWVDYNNNQISEFGEFEIATFLDQANYLRVALPSVKSIKTHQTLFSQSLHLNAGQWRVKRGFKKWLSQFSNQSSVLLDRKKRRLHKGFDMNPFGVNDERVIALSYNVRNRLFFRRGLQKYTMTYTYSNSKAKNNLGIGFQENNYALNEFQLQHRIRKYWLISLKGSNIQTINSSENYQNRNYEIYSKELTPTLTYNYSKTASFSLNYEYKTKKENVYFSKLEFQKMGLSYQYTHLKKGAMIADINLYKNSFLGDKNTPVAYQMLEGLQPGSNYVWNLAIQKKLSKLLHLNINYSGRKSDLSKTIHTGTVQIRANF